MDTTEARPAGARALLPTALLLSAALAACGGGVSTAPDAVVSAASGVVEREASSRPLAGPAADALAFRDACTQTGTTPTDTGYDVGPGGAPEISTGFSAKRLVVARSIMAVTANPIASRAACDVLRRGGNAVDAAIAAQMVLNVVEPQSSGIGGGAFMLVWDARGRTLRTYDGRETAPAAADENYLRWISSADRTPPQPFTGSAAAPFVQTSGRAIGTPGVLRMLELAHRNHGRIGWPALMQPGIRVADEGFPISPRLYQSVNAVFTSTAPATRARLTRDPDIAELFLTADRNAVKPIGTVLRNPALADTFRRIASGGADAFYGGELARAIVAEIRETYAGATLPDGVTPVVTTPGLTTLEDLASYRARERPPVCIVYRDVWEVCGMGPPSSGGLAVAQILGILQNFEPARFPGPDAIDANGGRPRVESVHLFAEANRLAYADRNRYVADTDFVSLPGGSTAAMLDRTYLASRAATIDPGRSMGTAQPGLGPIPSGLSTQATENGTTHMTIRDRDGNVVSMTTTIESGFGSWHMVRGFLLNNQLTDFDAVPVDATGAPIANRIQANKRPRSSMAPTIVFRRDPDGTRGDFHMATGSPGGATIIQYVAKTLVGVLDWNMDIQQAISMPNMGSRNRATEVEKGTELENVMGALKALGHDVQAIEFTSGLQGIVRTPAGLVGGADPRREGVVLGD